MSAVVGAQRWPSTWSRTCSSIGAWALIRAWTFILAWLSPGLILSGGGERKLEERLREPDSGAQKAAAGVLKDIFKNNYGKDDPAARKALARKLLQHGIESKGDAAERYVCFREARDLSSRDGDFRTALQAISQMDRVFLVDAPGMKLGALEATRRLLRTPEDHVEAAEEYLKVAEEALPVDRYDLAELAVGASKGEAEKARDKLLMGDVDARKKEIQGLRSEHERFQEARAVLGEGPSDQASLTVGRFLCLVKQDWDAGLPLLAGGPDASFVAVARSELARPRTPEEEAALADRWMELARTETGVWKVFLERRALHWYEKALPKLEGLSRERVEKLLGQLRRIAPLTLMPRRVYLSDLEEVESFVGHGMFGKKGELGYNPQRLQHVSRIRVKGKESPNGLSTHPPTKGSSHVIYNIAGHYRAFRAQVGVTDAAGQAPSSPLTFRVLGDDKLLWASRPFQKPGTTESCEVRLEGVGVLRLEVHCPGYFFRAHAVWVEPHLVR